MTRTSCNFGIVEEVCAANFVHHAPIPNIPPARDGMKVVGQFVTSKIHDITVSIDIWSPRVTYVADRISARGVRADNGQPISWNEHEFWRAENGRLAEQWSVAAGLDLT